MGRLRNAESDREGLPVYSNPHGAPGGFFYGWGSTPHGHLVPLTVTKCPTLQFSWVADTSLTQLCPRQSKKPLMPFHLSQTCR